MQKSHVLMKIKFVLENEISTETKDDKTKQRLKNVSKHLRDEMAQNGLGTGI